MAFPTRHWVVLSGLMLAGQRQALPHGLTSGLAQPGIFPNVPQVLFCFNSVNTAPPNVNIGHYQNPDATNVYLSNWDAVNPRPYSVMARMYYSDDSRNF
jgi:hypothetical protein